MKISFKDRLKDALLNAVKHNSQIMARPEVLLWLDPEKQWEKIIPALQQELPHLLVLGDFNPSQRQGPPIWIKCIVARLLPEAQWSESTVPVVYLPGLSKHDLKDVKNIGLNLQPLVEYLYTGTMFLHKNGKEWTVIAFFQNNEEGLGLKVSDDSRTREAAIQSLPELFNDGETEYRKQLDAEFFYQILIPDPVSMILKWLCKGDLFLQSLTAETRSVFEHLCKTKYDFEPKRQSMNLIVEKFGSQKNNWKQVWERYASAPQNFSEIKELLHKVQPDPFVIETSSLPKESFPIINEQQEKNLREALSKIVSLDELKQLKDQHSPRQQWVWAKLDEAPLAMAVSALYEMTALCLKPFSSTGIEEIENYYTTEGYKADQAMRHAFAAVKTQKDIAAATAVIRKFYEPWLKKLTEKFQLAAKTSSQIFYDSPELKGDFILFVDAFRYELAKEFVESNLPKGFKAQMSAAWSAVPSVTPTAKPKNSPMCALISVESNFNEFRPQLKTGKDLTTAAFRDALKKADYTFVDDADEIVEGKKYWMEFGDIDRKGHDEQAGVLRRLNELNEKLLETMREIFDHGIGSITIVTDHGWLLLPGGLPKVELQKDFTETRWGRCALIKEGVKTSLLHLPWQWNKAIHVAFAPDISFFRINEEYAHGGISVHECLIPVVQVEYERTVVAKIKEAKWIQLRCAIEVTGDWQHCKVDIRTKATDESTSLVLSADRKLVDGKISLAVDDSAEGNSVTIVLTDNNDQIIDKRLSEAGQI